MEKEKEKRKRNEEGDGEEGVQRKAKKKEEASEEEVEEFFAILRRMKVAVKYFEKTGEKGWRSAVEAEVVVAANEQEKESEDHKKGEGVEECGGGLLDLNALPEEKS